MVAYNLRKVEIRDRCPAPPLGRHSIGAVPRLVAPIAWVRFPVAARPERFSKNFVVFFENFKKERKLSDT